jgi:tetratricopeptide (TPR) repeat protein
MKPNYEEAQSNLGLVFLRQGRLDDALVQYEKALEIGPHSFSAHYNLGVVLGQKGQLNEAIREFKEALRLQPDFGPAQIDLAKAQSFIRQREGHQ